MLTGVAGHRLTHLLKSIQKNPQTVQYMKEMDAAHVSTWLHCLTASADLEHALSSPTLDQLSDLLDLPPAYGGIGLQSLEKAADEEHMGFFAGIAASMIAFCRRTELPAYIAIAEALESMGDAEDMLNEGDPNTEEGQTETAEAIKAVRSASARVATGPPTDDGTTNSSWPHSLTEGMMW